MCQQTFLIILAESKTREEACKTDLQSCIGSFWKAVFQRTWRCMEYSKVSIINLLMLSERTRNKPSWDRGTVKIKEFKPFFAVASEEKKEEEEIAWIRKMERGERKLYPGLAKITALLGTLRTVLCRYVYLLKTPTFGFLTWESSDSHLSLEAVPPQAHHWSALWTNPYSGKVRVGSGQRLSLWLKCKPFELQDLVEC